MKIVRVVFTIFFMELVLFLDKITLSNKFNDTCEQHSNQRIDFVYLWH